MAHPRCIKEMADRVPSEVEEPACGPLFRGGPIGSAVTPKVREGRSRFPGLPCIFGQPETDLLAHFTDDGDLLFVSAEKRSPGRFQRAIIPGASMLLKGAPGLGAVEGDGALSIQHKAGQSFPRGIGVQRIARFTASAQTPVIHTRKRRASVRTLPDALIRHDHTDI